ncbi:MAG: AMP-binding protein, partial [bacterium]|nr:AMP-binding protein [bacterium]
MPEEIRKVDENILLSSPKFAKQREYWLNTLTTGMEVTEILGDGNGSPLGPREGTGKIGICFPEELCRKLMKFSKNSDLSLYIALLTAVKLLIYRYTGSRDISVVSPLYKPNISRDTINRQLLIRVPFSGDLSFIELLLKTRQSVLEAYENQDYPFYKLMEHLYDGVSPLPAPSLSHVSCSLENIHGPADGNVPGVKFHFSFRREEGRVEANLLYHRDVYGSHYANRLLTYLAGIMESVLQDVKQAGSDISFLSEEEKRRLIFDFNRTDAVFPADKTISRLFEEQVERTPDGIAAVYENIQLTYHSLKTRADRLANQLRAKGAAPGSIVAVMVARSIETAVGILGILKAGSAYLPINPEYPEDRIIFMLQEADASSLVTENQAVKKYLFTRLQNLQAGDRKIHLTAGRPIIKNLDRLPLPNRSLIDYEKYNRYIGQSLVKNNIAMLGTRGCPYN